MQCSVTLLVSAHDQPTSRPCCAVGATPFQRPLRRHSWLPSFASRHGSAGRPFSGLSSYLLPSAAILLLLVNCTVLLIVSVLSFARNGEAMETMNLKTEWMPQVIVPSRMTLRRILRLTLPRKIQLILVFNYRNWVQFHRRVSALLRTRMCVCVCI